MKTTDSISLSEVEWVKNTLFGSSFSTEDIALVNDKVAHYITAAALLLAEKIVKQKPEYQERFLVATGQRIKSIPVAEVAYFLSEGRYVKLVTKKNEKYLLDQSLESLMAKIDPNLFFRINRQAIVSFGAIQQLTVWSKSRVKLDLLPAAESPMIVSIDNSKNFKNWLNR